MASDSEESDSEPFGSGHSDSDPDFMAEISSSTSSSNSDLDVTQEEVDETQDKVDETQNKVDQKRRSVKYPSEVEKASRKKKCNRDEWQKIKAKRLRNSGLSYESNQITKKNDGTINRVKVKRDKRKMLPPCNDKCRQKCFTRFTEDSRQNLFNEY